MRPVIFIALIHLTFIIPTAMGQKNPSYRYSDGNGNSYIIEQAFFEYRPVKPAESSSGKYDGGEPVKKTITDAQYQEISALLEKAAKDKTAHINQREMGSGSIAIITGDRETFCILPRGSAYMQEIEAVLEKTKK